MEELTDESRVEEALEALDRVFRSVDPFGEPFTDDVAEREFVFDVGYKLKKSGQFNALSRAARAVGDEWMWLTHTEGTERGREGDHWRVEFSDFDEYRKSPYGVFENALYSPEGTWGLLFSNESHVLIGGTGEFMEAFRERWPGPPLGPSPAFFEHWYQFGTKSSRAWIGTTLGHVYYGPSREEMPRWEETSAGRQAEAEAEGQDG